MPMAKKIDIITAAGVAYKKTWAERNYLLRMAMIPFLVKLACFTGLAVYGDEKSLWIGSIILLPSFFLEGWLLSHWARTIMTGGAHRWPFKMTNNRDKDTIEIMVRGRGVMAGTICYALVNFLVSGYYAYVLPFFPVELDPHNADPKLAAIAFISVMTSLFFFRYVWIYVPLAMNIPLTQILLVLKPMRLTFQMIGLWMICVVPVLLVLKIFGDGLMGLAGEANEGAVFDSAFLILRIATDMIKNLICTAGMAYVFLFLLGKVHKK